MFHGAWILPQEGPCQGLVICTRYPLPAYWRTRTNGKISASLETRQKCQAICRGNGKCSRPLNNICNIAHRLRNFVVANKFESDCLPSNCICKISPKIMVCSPLENVLKMPGGFGSVGCRTTLSLYWRAGLWLRDLYRNVLHTYSSISCTDY
jgi:hypothetical protein